MDRLRAVEDRGITLSRKREYYGEVPRDWRYIPDQVENIDLGLSPKQWIAIGMCDGDAYIGGCCGNTSAMQDIINGAFRDNGIISNGDFLDLADLARGHDGFDEFTKMDDEDFIRHLKDWDKATELLRRMPLDTRSYVDPWFQIGIIFNAVEHTLSRPTYRNPRLLGPDENDTISSLNQHLRTLSWNNLFTRDERGTASHLRRAQFERSRMFPLVSRLYHALIENNDSLDGFVLLTNGEIATNMYGLCIYADHESASDVLEIWKKDADEGAVLEVRPVTITIRDGMVIK